MSLAHRRVAKTDTVEIGDEPTETAGTSLCKALGRKADRLVKGFSFEGGAMKTPIPTPLLNHPALEMLRTANRNRVP